MTVAARGSVRPLTDPEAFRAFYRESLPIVYGYVYNRCGGDRALSEDLTQEAFMAAVRELKRGRTVAAPTPWIVGIAKHKLIDQLRSQERAERKLALVYEAKRVDEFPEWSEASWERSLSALRRVAPAQRAALVLRYIDGMSVPEVAAAIARSVHATESLLARGRESFKRAFLEIGDD